VHAKTGAAHILHAIRIEPVGETPAAAGVLLASVGVVISKDVRIPLCAQSVIRAPGYTMRLDHESGVSCYFLDADGHRRHGPTNESMHGYLGLGATMRDDQWIFRYRMPCRFIFDGPDKLIAVNGAGKDQARLTYTFEENQIRVGPTPPTDKERECTVWFGPFDVLDNPGKGPTGKSKNKKQERVTEDRLFFRHPVYRQGVSVRLPPQSFVRVAGNAFNVTLRTGDEVVFRFADDNEMRGSMTSEAKTGPGRSPGR